jgi:hypothetical protein
MHSASDSSGLSGNNVVASVGQLGDNTLAPASVDVSGLQLDQGKHCIYEAGCTGLFLVICIPSGSDSVYELGKSGGKRGAALR